MAEVTTRRLQCIRSIRNAGCIMLLIVAHATAEATYATAQTTRAAPRVALDAGVIEGAYIGAARNEAVFRGIPFAAPPVGTLRWKPPEPVRPWRGVRAAREFPPICAQHLYAQEYFGGISSRVGGRVLPQRPLTTSEDCLYLNVWTANLGSSRHLPVMVWVHGGGNNGGWGTQATTDGEFLARKGVVLVMIEYRVGALGFLADSSLSAESPHHSSGNYGLLDQIAALHWVQRNIAAFGGDPSRVTIFGQSSGALDVTCLTVSPLAAGLFQRVISESGACTGPFAQLGQAVTSSSEHEAAESSGRRLAADLGVAHARDPLAAMRARSADEIVAAAFADGAVAHEVIVDGWVIPEQPDIVLAQGRQQSVPLLIGSNADEYRTLARSFTVKSMAQYPEHLLAALGTSAPLRPLLPRLLAVYPARDTAEAERRLFEVNTDGFGGSARYFARAMERSGEHNVYLYYFTHVIPTPGGMKLGAFHTGEMPFVFGSDPGWPHGPRDAALRDAISGYWVQFATTGNPNRTRLPAWPKYDAVTDRYLELGDQIHARSHIRQAQYDLQDAAQSALDAMLTR
ncbi:MAG: carboxylesterase/lipase family protein [Gemmatimonadaceae bacterium]